MRRILPSPATLAALLAVLLLLGPGRASALDGSIPPPEEWSGLAGMAEELEAEELELRDELIAAQGGFLTALAKALDQAERLSPANPGRPLAWARVEYLLETSYRLLENTGEYENFFSATERLKPGPAGDGAAAAPELGSGEDSTPGAGLVFRDASGRRLLPALLDGGWTLVDAETSRPPPEDMEITAGPETPEAGERPGDFPLIRSRAAWLRALALERLGRSAEAAGEAAYLGQIRDWLALGPLDSEAETPLTGPLSILNPQVSPELQGGVAGPNGPVFWRPLSSLDPVGRLLPGAVFRSAGQKAVCALALVHSPRHGGAMLRFGSGTPAEVSVNRWFGRRERHGGIPDPGQGSIAVWLRKGWNVVFVRSVSGPGVWGLAARLTDLAGRPFPLRTAKPDPDRLPEFLAAADKVIRAAVLDRHYSPPETAAPDGFSILARQAGAHPDDARALFYQASLLAARRVMEGSERFDRERLFRQAVEASGGDAFFTLAEARHLDFGLDGPDREDNYRLILLRRAADRGSAAALADIGRLYLDVMRQPRRAAGYAGQALAANPLSLRAGILEYDALVKLGRRPLAGALLERLGRNHPKAAPARLRLGRSLLDGGRPNLALAEFHAVLGVDAANREALDGAVKSLGLLGQTSEAVSLLLKHIGSFPYDHGARLKLAGLYRTIGRDEEAERAVADALRVSPDDPAALAMRDAMERESRAAAKAAPATEKAAGAPPQELDWSPPREPPPDGWEYLYFQIADRLKASGDLERTVSFAIRVHSPQAALAVRHLRFPEQGREKGRIIRLEVTRENGRERLTPPDAVVEEGGLMLSLPPLQPGAVVEAEASFTLERPPFLGEYFGFTAPLTQSAPVRLSRYTFSGPRERRVFFRPANGAPEAMEAATADGAGLTRIWEMHNLAASPREPDAPARSETDPCVEVSGFADWNEFNRWFWRLVGGQYHSTPELVSLAAAASAGLENPDALARLEAAAKWVAKHVAHREWEFGAYAFRPINARSILARLAADGKDRTLLLCLLAREFGLEAWPVLARQRDSRFPSGGSDKLRLPLLGNFNYSLAMVDGGNGGRVFLDAANPYRHPAVMPSRLSGSPGLALLADAAEPVRIPEMGVLACRWEETARLTVDEDGSAVWSEDLVDGSGRAAETLRLNFLDPETRAAAWDGFLASAGGVPGASESELIENPADPASVVFSGRARLRNLAHFHERRAILEVPPLPAPARSGSPGQEFPLSLGEFAQLGVRELDLVLPHGFRVSRRLEVRYPEDWRLLNPVAPFRRQYAFGGAALEAETSPGVLSLRFEMEIPGHRLPAGMFRDFREMAALCGRWLNPVLIWERP